MHFGWVVADRSWVAASIRVWLSSLAHNSCRGVTCVAVACSTLQATNPRWLPPEVIMGAGASLASDV